MQNLFTNKTIAIGLEPEFVGVSPNQMNSFNTRSNLINGLSYKSDPSVGTEADLPVLADCQFTRDYMDSVYNQIQSQGGRVNVKCSTHIHLSTMPIKAGLTNEEFSRRSTEMRQSDRNYLLDQNKLNQLFDTNTSSRIPLEVMRDILIEYLNILISFILALLNQDVMTEVSVDQPIDLMVIGLVNLQVLLKF